MREYRKKCSKNNDGEGYTDWNKKYFVMLKRNLNLWDSFWDKKERANQALL